MIIYNVTVQTDNIIAEAWLKWLKDVHIPEILATKCFTSATILQLLEVDDTDGPTYAVQYKAESKSDYNRYINLYAEKLRVKSFEKWGSNFIAIRTLMVIVQ